MKKLAFVIGLVCWGLAGMANAQSLSECSRALQQCAAFAEEADKLRYARYDRADWEWRRCTELIEIRPGERERLKLWKDDYVSCLDSGGRTDSCIETSNENNPPGPLTQLEYDQCYETYKKETVLVPRNTWEEEWINRQALCICRSGCSELFLAYTPDDWAPYYDCGKF